MPKFEVNELNKNFNGLHAVKNFTANFEQNKITALVGPNGAGKTTVYNLINGFIKPSSGKIIYNNKKITSFSPDKIANLGIGRLFQDVRIFNKLTSLENLLVACKCQKGENPLYSLLNRGGVRKEEEVNKNKAMELLNVVGLKSKKNSLAENLSFGEQKLLAIARLLAGEYDVLCLDEPASGVNPVILASILALLKEIAKKGKVVVIIEHNMKVIEEVADFVYFMDHGEIIAQGKPDDVLNNPRVREIYIGL